MKLNDYIESLQKLVEDDLTLGDLDIIYAKDSEGNGYESVYQYPSLGFYEEYEREFTPEEYFEDSDVPDDLEVNSVCIN